MTSILESVKKMLGIHPSNEAFDPELIMHINTVFGVLSQIGAGLPSGFTISGSEETWEDYLGEDNRLEFIKSYVAQKVRLLFDPPTSSIVVQAVNESVRELEWRILVETDPIQNEKDLVV